MKWGERGAIWKGVSKNKRNRIKLLIGRLKGLFSKKNSFFSDANCAYYARTFSTA